MNYPFTAIVGQGKLKKALFLCAVNPAIGGLLIQGDKGTAKSTAARALAEVVPLIAKVDNCQFNCAEHQPLDICDSCQQTERRLNQVQVPFINLPIGATEERLIGSLDLQGILAEKKKKFQPGLLAAVHQGILYIDEVNLLPDHLVDVLLDVAAMGENIIERDGLSLSHPSRFTLIGTMNPEEGQLRPQFLDRFGLMVTVDAPDDVKERTEVVRRRIAFENNPVSFIQYWEHSQAILQERLLKAKQLLPSVQLHDDLLTLISELTTELGVKSLRADIVIYKTAITLAALDHRTEVIAEDIREAAGLALAHRSRRSHTQAAASPQMSSSQSSSPPSSSLQKSPSNVTSPPSNDGLSDQPFNAQFSDNSFSDKKTSPSVKDGQRNSSSAPGESSLNKTSAQNTADQEIPDGNFSRANSPDKFSGSSEKNNPAPSTGNPESRNTDAQSTEQIFGAGDPIILPQVKGWNSRSEQSGKRTVVPDSKRGAYIRPAPLQNGSAIAADATILHALQRNPEELQITMADLQQKQRKSKVSNLILFVVDASGSMAASKRMEAVKGTVLQLLTDAYQKRDTVGVIAFRGIDAKILLHPTQSIERAEEAMRSLPTGGRTPLPHALQTAMNLADQYSSNHHPVLIILTDGKANVALEAEGDPWAQTLELAARLKNSNVQSLIVNTESNFVNLNRAEELAKVLGAQYVSLHEISEENLLPVIGQLL
jgi:magnesium chelatase subunit D